MGRKERLMRKILFLGVIALGTAPASWGQLEPPNELGVSFAQWGTIVRDVNATKKFWVGLGGEATIIDGTDVVKFPGVFVFLRKGSPTGGSFGSVVNHVGFQVQNNQEAVAKWRAAGLNAEYAHSVFIESSLGWAYTPDNLKIEINSEKSLPVPIAAPHVHIWVVDSARPEISAWYAKTFAGVQVPANGGLMRGGIPGVRLGTESSQNPRALSPRSIGLINGELPAPDSAIVKSLVNPPAPTKGRTIDYLGFEVNNLEAFCKKLEASGIKFDEPYSKTRHKSYASARFTDPWGVSIELTEGLRHF
jgi:hypothetical protein